MSNGLILRKNVGSLADADLAALRDAYAKIMALTDNRGYNYWAGLHGVPGGFCWHAPRRVRGQLVNLFLPWHRAYILFFEHAFRDQNPEAALPWWDWTSDESHATGVPEAFSVEQVDGNPNPLFKAHISIPSAQPPIDRDTSRFPGDPNDLPLPDDVTNLFEFTHFDDFSNQLQGIHNFIHGWTGGVAEIDGQQVGGDMGVVATAAFDPIFWSHHCFIDRTWYMWQLRNGTRNIPTNYLDMVLAPFSLTVRDVLDINTLGYEYATSGVIIPA